MTWARRSEQGRLTLPSAALALLSGSPRLGPHVMEDTVGVPTQILLCLMWLKIAQWVCVCMWVGGVCVQKTLSRRLCQIERSLSTRHVLCLELNAWVFHLSTELNMFMASEHGILFLLLLWRLTSNLVTFTGSGVGHRSRRELVSTWREGGSNSHNFSTFTKHESI